jgi:hypothetical protein
MTFYRLVLPHTEMFMILMWLVGTQINMKIFVNLLIGQATNNGVRGIFCHCCFI